MKEDQIVSLLTPVVTLLGLELEAVDVLPAGKRRLLRIVLDGEGANGRGPNLNDIAEATKAISAALDTDDVTGNSPYTLEVSSRGVGRPLELPRHWRRNAGRLAVVTTSGGERVTGRIISSSEGAVLLDVASEQREISFSAVTKAHVEVELNRAAPELDDPELDDPELDDPDLEEEVDERGLAEAGVEGGRPGTSELGG